MEQKNKELAIDFFKEYKKCRENGVPEELAVLAVLSDLADWKDKQDKEQQMIEYLYKNIQSLLKDYGVSEASADLTTQLFLANFKKAMW